MWPFPSSRRPGHHAAPANWRPSRETSPKCPLSIRIPMIPSHCPVVGAWLKSHGHPGSQLQFLNHAPSKDQVSAIATPPPIGLAGRPYPGYARLAMEAISQRVRRRGGQRQNALQLGLVVLLFGLAAIAWALTARTMRGMDMGPGTDLGSLSFYVGAWVVMMAAMMFPSISPMVRTYALVQRSRYSRRGMGEPTAAIGTFVAGYLLTWTAFGLLAYAVFTGVRALDIAAFSWDRGGPYLAG